MAKCLVDGCTVSEPKSDNSEAFDMKKFKYRLAFGFICPTHTHDIREGFLEMGRVCKRAEDKAAKIIEEKRLKDLHDAKKKGVDLTKRENKITEYKISENVRQQSMMQKMSGKTKKGSS